MAYYYKYEFISPVGIFANIKEELKSYFDTGVIDDIMFPVYVDKCLRKLGKATYNIVEQPMVIENYYGVLPDNFHSVREAWLCTVVKGTPIQSPSAVYCQVSDISSIQLNPVIIGGVPCQGGPECVDPNCPSCLPEFIQAVYKTTSHTAFTYKKSYLLKPGNINASNHCDNEYAMISDNPYASTMDSFDIHDNRFFTNFRTGVVHLIFYVEETCTDGLQMVPDNYEILEYIEAFIKYKMFEKLYNTVTDETLAQIERKMQFYKQESDENAIKAETEIKKQTVWQKQRSIKRSLRRHRRFDIAGSRPNLTANIWKENN